VPEHKPGALPAKRERQEFVMVLVRTSWTGGEGDPYEDFQLIELSSEKNREQFRQEILDQCRAQDRENCAVELFDPDNVPPGTIPIHARITPGQPQP